MSYTDLSYFSVPLPEDIERLIYTGEITHARQMINNRLSSPHLPELMIKRLKLELSILDTLPKTYCLTEEDVFQSLSQAIEDFTIQELDFLREEGTLDWIFYEGKRMYHRRCCENAIKTKSDLSARRKDKTSIEQEQIKSEKLMNMIHHMKDKGYCHMKYQIRETMILHSAELKPGEKVWIYLPLPVSDKQCKPGPVQYFTENIVTGKKDYSPVLDNVYVADEKHCQRTLCFETTYQPEMRYGADFSYEIIAPYIDAASMISASSTATTTTSASTAATTTSASTAATTASASTTTTTTSASTASPDKKYSHPVKKDWPSPTSEDTQELLPQIAFTPYMKLLAKELIGNETDPLVIARRFYDYVTTVATYRFVPPYFTKTCIPEYFSAGLHGDCGMHALTFITLCRIAGIPARWQAGWYTFPYTIGNHDWACFYVEPYGWLFADGSFGGSAYRSGNMEKWNFYFGNLDPFRMVANSDLQQEFDPSFQFLRNDPYDNQTGEVRNTTRSLNDTEYSLYREMFSAEEL